MKYYKIIKDNNIIGAIASNDFIKYSPITDCYLSATDLNGEYAVYKNKLYRSSWMQPIKQLSQYEEALIITITEDEYNAFIDALKIQNEIENIKTEEEIIEETIEENIETSIIDPIDKLSIDFIRSSKLNEMSFKCRKTIENGFDLVLRGITRHFSLTIQDQLNLVDLANMAQITNEIPYHADNEEVIFYTNEEINTIISTATSFKIYQTTYFNALKNYINSLETIEEISAIQYGDDIPEKFKTEVLKTLEYR